MLKHHTNRKSDLQTICVCNFKSLQSQETSQSEIDLYKFILITVLVQYTKMLNNHLAMKLMFRQAYAKAPYQSKE